MTAIDRRFFLGCIGNGMFLAGLGTVHSLDCGRGLRLRTADPDRLDFGPHEALARLMQETEPAALLPLLKGKLDGGVTLETLVTAAALANARTFGGEDYDGYHAFMALAPSLVMASRLPKKEAPLPVFKVLHRSTSRIARAGGRTKEVLRQVKPDATEPVDLASRLVAESRKEDVAGAERVFAAGMAAGPEACYRALQPLVREDIDVHQAVLAWRAWDMMRLAGPENALTLLRQAVRHVVNRERVRLRRGDEEPAVRSAVPRLIEQHHLEGKTMGTRRADDAWVERLARLVARCSRPEGAGAVAEALAEGFHPDDIGEALSLAATLLLLHDSGSTREQAGFPKGSVHGASVGVHASDAAHAWRHIARVVDPANAIATLIIAGWHTAGQGGRSGADPVHTEARERAKEPRPERVADALDDAVLSGDQKLAAALVERLGAGDPEAVFARVFPHLLANDGALHHEKYFATQVEVVAWSRPAFRWHHLAALARVAASGAGQPSQAVTEARALLGA